VQLGSDIDGEAEVDFSGGSVSINSAGDVVAIGAWLNDGANGVNSGHVRVFNNALLSIEEVALDSQITMYPNPSYGNSTIQFGGIHQNINLQIFDALGKLIETKSYSNIDKIPLDVQSYSKGLYLTKINSKEKLATLKLIVS